MAARVEMQVLGSGSLRNTALNFIHSFGNAYKGEGGLFNHFVRAFSSVIRLFSLYYLVSYFVFLCFILEEEDALKLNEIRSATLGWQFSSGLVNHNRPRPHST